MDGASARRALLACDIGLAIGLSAAALRSTTSANGTVATDFSVFATGWWMILHGQGPALYDAGSQAAAQRVVMHGAQFEGGLLAFLNPPHAAVAGVPLGFLVERVGVGAAFVLAVAINIGLLVLLARGLRQTVGVREQNAPLLTAGLFAFYPAFEVIKLGQFSLLLAVAVLGLYRAIVASRERVAAAWLLVLSIKPQLLLPIVVFLVCRRCYRVLVWSAMFALGAMVITSVVLGPTIWFDYLRNIRTLEQFFGTGTADYMLNVRGVILRVAQFAEPHLVEAAAFALSLATSACLAALFWFRHLHQQDDCGAAFALAISVALLFSPHLFVQDAVIWIVPLTLIGSAAFTATPTRLRVGIFVLVAPILFTLAQFIGSGTAPHASSLSLDLQFLILAVVAVVALFEYESVVRRGVFGSALAHPSRAELNSLGV